MSLIIPPEYLQQKATPYPRCSRRVPTGFLPQGRAPSAPLRALSTAAAAPTARLRLIPCPRVIAALLAPPPTSGAVVAPPGLPPRGSWSRLAPRAPRVRPGSLRRLGGVLPAPVLLAPCGSRSAPLLAALLVVPRVLGASPPPRGSPRMARQGSPPRLGARPYASACGLAAPSPPSLRVAHAVPAGHCGSYSFVGASWLGLRPALYLRPLHFAILAELVSRPPPLRFGGLCPPTADSIVPSALCTYRVGWGCASLVIRPRPRCRSIPSFFGIVYSGLPPVLFVWRRRVRLFEPWPTLRPSARGPLPVPPLGRGPNSPPSFPRSLRSRPPFGRASGRAVETFFVGYAQPVPNVACVFYEATTSWAEQEHWHPTKAVPNVPSSLSAPLLWGREGEAVPEWTHVDQCCVPSSLHVDLRVSIPAPPLYCPHLPTLLISPRRPRRSTTTAATFCHCLRYANLFRSMAGGFSNCVVDV